MFLFVMKKTTPRYYDFVNEDDDDDIDPDDACAECTLPCLFLLGPATVFLVLGGRGLYDWMHETGSARERSLSVLRVAVARWEQHRPLLAAVKLMLNVSTPGQPPQAFEVRELLQTCQDRQTPPV